MLCPSFLQMDYVTQKSVAFELEASRRNWARKVEIVEMAAKRARRVLARSAGASNHVGDTQMGFAPGAFSGDGAGSGSNTHLPRIH
jgi:hypothetical protein